MEIEASSRQTLIGAALMIVIGVVVGIVGVGYKAGSLTNMGAGYVPVVLGVLFVVIGLLMAVTELAARGKAVRSSVELVDLGHVPAGPGAGRVQWRGWSCILGGIAAFVVAGDHFGLVPATFLAVSISALGDRTNSLRDALLLAAGITLAGVLIFSFGLKLTFPLFMFS
jgi:hypothetical protein